ncbi:MAG: preprotein translocase subunit YajC [Candidatus Schekmanbacteria bacterium RBG_16_38_10]|uniref:Preprotein translocase subunit YajC n=1 Tax=Candidatus Schekmanbacteria bacterium RBG_16_38_10 TaxID=1817879 RepID=A0A1F7RNY0_9BACT|nr:MAG: preprotein translocase subunit YajC [Candidatus Schekmanbacteria bacterium RBG_16_38_10]
MFGIAYAMGAGGQQQTPGSSFSFIAMMLVIFGLFYLLLIRPQQKEQKKTQEMLSNVNRGDKVLTKGGIYGIVVQTKDDILVVKIADNVKVDVARNAIASVIKGSGEEEKK